MMMESKAQSPSLQQKKWFLPLILSALFSSLLISVSLFFSSSSLSLLSFPFSPSLSSNDPQPLFVESKLKSSKSNHLSQRRTVPRLAYLISGSAGDSTSLARTLKALYHPNNFYAVHLDLEAPVKERLELANLVRKEPVYAKFNNVWVITRANLVTYRGPTMVANTLHAAAILLKQGGDWDWFINLSSSDYPLVTQDDLLCVLSTLPRGMNFIEHTSDIGWKEYQRAKPVIIDPGLYSSQKSDVFWITEKRSVPTAFKLFTGSAWMMLTHDFIEFCIWGWDNLPRTVLMYYANFLSSPEGYFHTVICNSQEFKNTTVNHDLHFISWDNPPKQHPHFLTLDDFTDMVKSNAPFARKFGRHDPVLDKIDKELLKRDNETGFVMGKWNEELKGNLSNFEGYFVKDVKDLRPGEGAKRIENLIKGLVNQDGFDDKHCV